MAEEVKSKGSSSSSRSGRCRRVFPGNWTEKELEECVDGFNKQNFIGKFQFGEVYRGICDEKEVIVKIWKEEKLRWENKGRLEDERVLHEYFSEHEFHPNLAKAWRICHDRKHLAIVYTIKPKTIDTLYNLIQDDDFTWEKRIKVAFGLAALLRYMHTPHPDCPSNIPYIIHNIDAAHILVDQDHEPVLFDFSMISGGILTDKRDLLNQHLQECCRYNDPIRARPGRWSNKCDVFYYGVVLLSLISKRRIYKDTDLPLVYEWARNERKQHNLFACFAKFKSSLVHQSLESQPGFHFSDVIEITKLALLCVEYDPQRRPTMNQIVRHMQKLHIVQDNANTWECCKMLDGIKELPYSPKYIRVKEFWKPSKRYRSLLINRFKHLMHGNKVIKSSITEHDVIKVFSYEELIKATSSFGKENLIGQFQFGNLFCGEIKGKKVIVKIWEDDHKRGVYGRHNEDRLRDEISLLLHPELFTHPNVVKVIGYCFEEEKLGAVYDLDPQDSLHNLATKDEFTWLQRIKVIYEFANLLKFFHGPNPPYAPHRVGNVDAANIILDKDYRPKLCDFGMTVGGIILSLRDARNFIVRGPRGYNHRNRGIRIEDGDIASYGWILLCLISKTFPEPDDDDPIYDALGWKDSEESVEVDRSGMSLVHKDLTKGRGFYENDGVELTKLGMECTDLADCPPMKEVVKRLQKLRVFQVHAEEMGVENLPCRYNTDFKLVQKYLDR